MPVVKETVTLAVAADEAWATVTDVESYATRMDTVRSVSIIDQLDDTHRRTAWSVLMRGSVLQWIEREVLDNAARVVTFEQESGDMETFSGSWSVHEIDQNHCEVTLFVEFEIGIPLLADMLNPIAATALRESAISMLNALEHDSVAP